jgi:hypothetical protein
MLIVKRQSIAITILTNLYSKLTSANLSTTKSYEIKFK